LLKHIYQYDTIVIGGNISALLYSYYNNLPLVINDLDIPHRFKKLNNKSQLEIWNKTYFRLSLAGLNVAADKAQSLRLREGELTVTTKHARVIKINFNKAIIFDDKNISGLPLSKKENDQYEVLDWMYPTRCAPHDTEYIYAGGDLVREVYFYLSRANTGRRPVAVSYLTKKQLNDFEYSDTYAKFKCLKVLEDNDIKGTMGTGPGGVRYRYRIKLEVLKREVRKMAMNLYDDTEELQFRYDNPEDILKGGKLAEGTYLFKVQEVL